MNKRFRIFKRCILYVYVIAMVFVFRTPVKAAVSSYTAVKEYNSFLTGMESGAFSIVYLNNNTIPDMVFDYNENGDAYTVVFVDGFIGTLDGHRSFILDRNSRLKDRDIYYFPKKSLLEITDSKYAIYEDYYYRLSSVGAGETDLWRILYQDSDDKIYQGCTQSSRVSSGKTYGSYWDQLLGKWIVRYKVSVSKFFSVRDKLVGSTELRYCVLYNNTPANRTKYVNANSYVTASIKLNKSNTSLREGQSMTLKATVTGKSKTVTWSSSNKDVATVTSGGKVSAKKTGKTTITAKANGKTASCTLTVTSSKELSFYKGKKLGLAIQAFPNGYKEYKYGIMYWRYQGVHFHGNGEYAPMNDVIISYVSLQGTTDYTLGGMKPGISKAKAIQTVTGNGWKYYKRGNVISGEDLIYGPKNGKYIELYFVNGKLNVISYY